MTGKDDPNVALHRDAYETLERMRAGDIAKVSVGNDNYLLAALPTEGFATALVMFVH